MSFISDVLDTPEAKRSAARASARWAALTDVEKAAQRRDADLTDGLTRTIADAEREYVAGRETEASRERARKADEALTAVEARTRARLRNAERRRQHAARSRESTIDIGVSKPRPHARTRERADRRTSRARSRSPDGDDGCPGSRRPRSRRGHRRRSP